MKTTTLEREAELLQERPEVGAQSPDVPDEESVAELAYQYWEERGRPQGTPQEDWYRAVQDLTRRHAA
jgi:hypothetical protein